MVSQDPSCLPEGGRSRGLDNGVGNRARAAKAVAQDEPRKMMVPSDNRDLTLVASSRPVHGHAGHKALLKGTEEQMCRQVGAVSL